MPEITKRKKSVWLWVSRLAVLGLWWVLKGNVRKHLAEHPMHGREQGKERGTGCIAQLSSTREPWIQSRVYVCVCVCVCVCVVWERERQHQGPVIPFEDRPQWPKDFPPLEGFTTSHYCPLSPVTQPLLHGLGGHSRSKQQLSASGL
jgi:hypothetical protein